MTVGRRQVLAHGPLGKVENSMSLNVIVGHSDDWCPGEGVWGPWGTVTGIPGKSRASYNSLCVIKGDKWQLNIATL